MGSKASNSALGTLVERTTRYLLLVSLQKHDAYTVRTEFAKAVKKIPQHLKKTLTYDRGTEIAQHKLFTADTKIQIYLAEDRKSTRLNSSHQIISYAVFCLKKKKQ